MDNKQKKELLAVLDKLCESELSLLERKYGITKSKIASDQVQEPPEITAESNQEMTDYFLEKIRKKRDERKQVQHQSSVNVQHLKSAMGTQLPKSDLRLLAMRMSALQKRELLSAFSNCSQVNQLISCHDKMTW